MFIVWILLMKREDCVQVWVLQPTTVPDGNCPTDIYAPYRVVSQPILKTGWFHRVSGVIPKENRKGRRGESLGNLTDAVKEDKERSLTIKEVTIHFAGLCTSRGKHFSAVSVTLTMNPNEPQTQKGFSGFI